MLIVKEAIVPSESVAPNPVNKAVLLGCWALLALLATGGLLTGAGVGEGTGMMAATLALAGVVAP